MSCHINRSVTKHILDIIHTQKEEQFFRTEMKPSYCHKCELAFLVEVSVPTNELKIECDGIDTIVTYQVQCNSHHIKPVYIDCIEKACYDGVSTNQNARCMNCKYGEPLTASVNSYVPQNKKKNGAIKKFVVIYRCNNRNRMEHFTKGTAMNSRIRCENYEERSE